MTIFYIDRKFSVDERKIIEENLAKKNCTAAIYDCCYYLFIHKDPPKDSFRIEILKELRTILTCNSYYNVLIRLVNIVTSNIDTKIMSSAEFSELLIEIYDFQIDFNPEENFKILKLKILDTDKVSQIQLRPDSELWIIELENYTNIVSFLILIPILFLLCVCIALIFSNI